ncbi:sugar nucleotide-binding protein [Phenylobacterium sp. LjRoot219]|uniref:SDR family oxidoreductase n=1 Tax=Phenylobacterium sp. LjRoot219 TaxID=3342283 RepID=UPI003ECDD9A6
MSSPRLLVLGDTGLAGTALLQTARARGLAVTGASRHGERAVDLTDAASLKALLAAVAPTTVINAAALVSVADCERDPGRAWLVNARPVSLLAEAAREQGFRFVQVSTDHFYSGDGRRAHGEGEPVVLLNDYARSKYAAEGFALTAPDALVVRTNILGLKSATGGSFGEWALGVIGGDTEATLFEDQFVSILDIWSFAEGLLDLAASPARGVINLASSEVYSKAELVEALATALGRKLTRARRGSVGQQAVRRPDSLGLNVSRAEAVLGRRLPGLQAVAARFAGQAMQRARP